MKTLIFFLLLTLFDSGSLETFVFTSNELYGDIDTSLIIPSGVYTTKQNLTVKQNSHVKFSPNVTLLFNPNTSLIIEGKLDLNGTSDKMINLKLNLKYKRDENIILKNEIETKVDNLKYTTEGEVQIKHSDQWLSICSSFTNLTQICNSFCKIFSNK